MNSKITLQFDHLNLSDDERRMISEACLGGSVVYLAPLDKGLSGSTVWLAKWKLLGGNLSKFHVFKIGEKRKLDRENNAIKSIASVIEPGFPHVAYFSDDRTDRALLRQEFIGDPSVAKSLRQFMETATPKIARETLDYLFMNRMKFWHPPQCTYQTATVVFSEALDWWWCRIDIEQAAKQIGYEGLEESLKSKFSISLVELETEVKKIAAKPSTLAIGAIHGDLHAQNVLVGTERQLELIDFGRTNQEKWKAIDFLMMECSLKLACTPPHATLTDLLKMEQLLDENNGKPPSEYEELLGAMHGTALASTASAIHVTRHSAATLSAVTDFNQYREGLVILMACLASLPTLLNRPFLFHSIAHHLQKLRTGKSV